MLRKAAIIAGAQLYEQPLSRTGFDDRVYNVHIRREDGKFLCCTLPLRALTDLDLLVGWLRVWAHDPAEVEAHQRQLAQQPPPVEYVKTGVPAFPRLTPMSPAAEREAKRLHRQRR
jgi:hypothetical protein